LEFLRGFVGGKRVKHRANALVRNALSFLTVTSGRKGYWSYALPKAESILPNPGTRAFSRSGGFNLHFGSLPAAAQKKARVKLNLNYASEADEVWATLQGT
jgi:hypothetical protein